MCSKRWIVYIAIADCILDLASHLEEPPVCCSERLSGWVISHDLFSYIGAGKIRRWTNSVSLTCNHDIFKTARVTDDHASVLIAVARQHSLTHRHQQALKRRARIILRSDFH